MYCTGCGNELREVDQFCPMCGRAAHGQATQQAWAPQGEPKKLVRPMNEKSIGGVCAGFARYLGLDVALTRILWLLIAIFTGVGFIAYLVCWIIMPAEYGPPAPAAAQSPANSPQQPDVPPPASSEPVADSQ